MTLKYLVCAGGVVSSVDGQSHWISATALIRLYGVDPRECLVATLPEDAMRPKELRNLTVLKPREDGNYKLGSA